MPSKKSRGIAPKATTKPALGSAKNRSNNNKKAFLREFKKGFRGGK